MPALSRHPKFWLDDGDLLLVVEHCCFRVHKTVLFPESRALHTWQGGDTELVVHQDVDLKGCDVVCVPGKAQVGVGDAEALLKHLYRDTPISVDSPFLHVAAVLRVSSPQQLDFPQVHALGLEVIESMFPSGPKPFVHPAFLPEALDISLRYRISSIRKGLYYSLVTTSNFDMGELEDAEQTVDSTLQPPSTLHPSPSLTLSAIDAQHCTRLMHHLIDHFTPILFTPATTVHMSCTDVFADQWMDLVIQPAIEDDGVYKPLETLQKIIDIDWAKEGLCDSCVQEKRTEWQEEQQIVWSKVDSWLNL